MWHRTYSIALLSAVAGTAAAVSPSTEKWAERSIYQIMTDRFARPPGSSDETCDPYKYCGGSWTGIIDKLDYIQDLGFTAVQISPVVENIPDNTEYGEAYHGYWPQNMYSLNEHFGTADDLRKLADELHKRDMYLMVDVVINDMAQAANSTGKEAPKIDWSRLIPFDEEKYYHPFCNITDWNDPTNYQDCWFGVDIVALPDLKTEDDAVVSMIQDWVKGLVGNYSIDGLRIDATKHMNDAYLTNFSTAAGVFTMGEVYTEDTGMVCRYEDLVSGLLNYPLYAAMVQAFTAGNMPGLAQKLGDVKDVCEDFTRLATFIENHDIPRFASLINDTTLAKNAMAFNILSDGIPIVYQGQEQHMKGEYSPYNREPLWSTNYNSQSPLYNLTATLNAIRNHAIRLDQHYISNHSQELYLDGSTFVARKGSEGSQIVSVFSNQGSKGGPYDLVISGAFAPDTEVMEVLSCTKVTADSKGNTTVQMNAGEPKVLFPVQKLDGSGLCGFQKEKTASPSKDNTTANSSSNSTDKDSSSSSIHHGPSSSILFTTGLLCAFVGAMSWLF